MAFQMPIRKGHAAGTIVVTRGIVYNPIWIASAIAIKPACVAHIHSEVCIIDAVTSFVKNHKYEVGSCYFLDMPKRFKSTVSSIHEGRSAM
jgi:hypothetical protein